MTKIISYPFFAKLPQSQSIYIAGASSEKSHLNFLLIRILSHKTAASMYTLRQIAVTLVFPLLIIFLTTPPPLITAAVDGGTSLSAYDLLESYEFPVGILPKGVTGYDLDKSTGKFSAYLNGSCSFALEGSYQLRYKSKFGGYIAKRRLTSLYGVSVKILFFWLNIVEVVKNGDNLEFSVGIASASFPLYNFLVCPQCGCGLNCNSNGHILKIRNSHLLSSV